MLKQLVLNNIPKNSKLDPDQIKSDISDKCFYMQTCQRTLVLSYENNPLEHLADDLITLEGEAAYAYLLEIICGLKSKLIGENEIVGQFKTSYKEYVRNEFDSRLLQILEKLFKDAKDIRSQYLIGLSQKTYASIARKKIVSEYGADTVVILGSGQLAEDLINQFKKKINVVICARNTEKVAQLSHTHDLSVIAWDEREKLNEHAFIVNTIGAKEILIDEDHFNLKDQTFTKHLLVDLGSPSIIHAPQRNLKSGYMSLDDIFKEGAIREEKKRKQVTLARLALNSIVEKRSMLFTQKAKSAHEITATEKCAYAR